MNTTAFLVVLRESLESMLILALLTAVVLKSGERRAMKYVLGGAVGGVVAAVAAGWVIYNLPDVLSETALNWFSVMAPLVAAVLLVQVIWGMRHHAQAAGSRLKAKVHESLSAGDMAGLAVASFLAIAREGFETVLFLGGEILSAQGLALVTLLLSGIAGFAVAGFAFLILQTGLRRIGMMWFFRVTMVLLMITAVTMLAESYRQAHSTGLI